MITTTSRPARRRRSIAGSPFSAALLAVIAPIEGAEVRVVAADPVRWLRSLAKRIVLRVATATEEAARA